MPEVVLAVGTSFSHSPAALSVKASTPAHPSRGIDPIQFPHILNGLAVAVEASGLGESNGCQRWPP